MCNIEYSHLSKIEFGKINTSLSHLLRISNALEICIVCLFTNEDVNIEDLQNDSQINISNFSTVHEFFINS